MNTVIEFLNSGVGICIVAALGLVTGVLLALWDERQQNKQSNQMRLEA